MSTSKRKFNANADKLKPTVDPEYEIGAKLATFASNLWGEMAGNNKPYFQSLSVSRKLDGTFLAVLRSTDSAGGKWVAFGSANSYVGALLAVSSAVAKDAWREDKFA